MALILLKSGFSEKAVLCKSIMHFFQSRETTRIFFFSQVEFLHALGLQFEQFFFLPDVITIEAG